MSQITTAEPPPVLDYFKPPSTLRPVLTRAAFWSAIFFITTAALVLGLILRRYAWDQTEPIRYILDINNAFEQGSEVLQIGGNETRAGDPTWDGYIDRYDEQDTRRERVWFMDLDYAPGRLAIATLWSKWVREQVDGPITDPSRIRPWQFYPRARQLHRQYELCKPMLMINTSGEILSAIAMFFLVRRYTSGKPPDLRPTRGIILGLIASLLFWFNPALIWNAHCWPQWDSWVLPFFLWALLLASLNWWFCAGLIIALGAMFKGQILFGAPIFLLWPLFQGRLLAMARWIVGLLTGTAGITAVWLVRTPGTNPTGTHFLPGSTNPHAIEWVVYLTMIFAAMVSMIWLPRKSYFRLPVGVVVAAVLAWMIASNTNHVYWLLVFTVLAAAGWVIDNQSTSWSWKFRLPLAWFAAAILIYPIFVLARQAPTPVLTSEVSESASFEPEAAKSKIHANVADWSVIGIVLIATGSTGMMLYFAPRRVIPYAAAAWIAAALLSCMPVFNTSSGWFFWGFAYGTHHYEKMASGENNNLAELLKTQWNWDDLMAPAISLPKGQLSDSIGSFLTAVDPGVKLVELTTPDGGIGLPLKYLLVTVWVVSVILCSIGAAMHDRNRSPRFLAAIATPWIMFFAVMVQMHQRYLLWGASLTAATAVLSPGYALLHIFLSIVAMSQEMKSMLDDGRYQNNPVDQFIQNWHPGITWAMLLTAGIFLYTSLKWEKSPAKALAKE